MISKGKQTTELVRSKNPSLFSTRCLSRDSFVWNGKFKKFRKLGWYTRKRILIGWRKNGMERRGHPLARYFNSYYSWKRCGYTYRCQYTRGRSVHSAPIDNRWNKKLEFVYSLVTQIRAAIPNHPPLSSFRLLSQHERPPFPPPSHPRRGSTNI